MAFVTLTQEDEKRSDELMKFVALLERKLETAKKELRAIIYKIEKR